MLTVVIAAMAWILAHEPIRARAVLVVATPCPLILAVPVAIISGMSRTARFGVLVKDGGVLETLARIRIAVLDKTGTLTHGQAAVTEVRAIEGYSETDILMYAAGLDQASGHVVAAALVAEATRRGLAACRGAHARPRQAHLHAHLGRHCLACALHGEFDFLQRRFHRDHRCKRAIRRALHRCQ